MTKIISIFGATAVGKTECAIKVAEELGCEIISADSRQFYKEMTIGTAVPSPEELAEVKHNMIHSHSIFDEPVTAGIYEREAMSIINQLNSEYIVVVGGSGLYIKALLYGLDSLPKDNDVRQMLQTKTIEELRTIIEQKDQALINQIDMNNRRRVERAVEVIVITGRPYSEQRTGAATERNIDFAEIILDRPRELLYDRINQRVDIMIQQGLLEEARELYPHRELQPLQTVGYRELFDAFDGTISVERATELIKQNTRRYAKRQLTWARSIEGAKWVKPNEISQIIDYARKTI